MILPIGLGQPGTTITHTSTDTAQALSAVTGWVAKNSDGQVATAVLISVRTKAIRIAFTATPTQAGLGHDVAAASEILVIGYKAVKNLKFLSAANGEAGVMAITPFYGV